MEKSGTSIIDAAEEVDKPGIGIGRANVEELDKAGIGIGRVNVEEVDKPGTSKSRTNVEEVDKPGIGTGIGRADIEKADKPSTGTSKADIKKVDKPGTGIAIEDPGTKNNLQRLLVDRKLAMRQAAARTSLFSFCKVLYLIFSSSKSETVGFLAYSSSFLISIAISIK